MSHQQQVVQEEKTEQKSVELVGSSVPRVDAKLKVTGRAVYAFDTRTAFMLHAAVKRSPHPHARIVRIDSSPASRIPGVRAIVTGRDFPHHRGSIDTPALAFEEVLYFNQAVVAVAADTKEAAVAAVQAIDVHYDPLPAVFDPELAMSGETPCVIRPSETPSEPANVGLHLKLRKGDVESGFREADLVIENKYRTAPESHFQMEPLNFLAQPDPDGGVTLCSTSSAAHKVRLEVSHYLGLEPHLVRSRVPMLGGWFGSKEECHMAAVCAMLALRSQRPVKLALSREEMMTATGVRHPAIFYLKDGVRKSDGKVIARQVRAIYDGGAYGVNGNSIMKNSLQTAVAGYDIPNLWVDCYRVYTNRVPGSAKRAPMGSQMSWAIESAMDEIAASLGFDPVRFRLNNVLRSGMQNAMGEVMEDISHDRCLTAVAERAGWTGRGSEPRRGGDHAGPGWPWKVGRGVAIATKGAAIGPHQALVRIRESGKVEVWADIVENGQGISTGMAQLVATEFGIPFEDVLIMSFIRGGADSAVSGVTGGASASRQLTTVGKAVLLACLDAKKRLAQEGSRQLGVRAEELEVRSGKIYPKTDPSKSLKLSEIFLQAKTIGGMASFLMSGDVIGQGTVLEKAGEVDRTTGRLVAGKFSAYYTTAAQCAEVLVNVETGQVKVRRVIAAMDVGRAVNPRLVEHQIVGSVAMGMSEAMGEELIVSNGTIANAALADYKILTTVDVPEIVPIIVETEHDNGPFGAKPAGEASVMPTAAAIRNAVADACGVWIHEAPITPEKVLEGLSSQS